MIVNVTTTTEYEQVQLHIVCMTLLSVLLVFHLDTVEASCTFEDKEVCEGKIVKEIGKRLVKICVDGKLRTKPRKTILPWTGARDPGSCVWYGEVLCDGDVVQVGGELFYFYCIIQLTYPLKKGLDKKINIRLLTPFFIIIYQAEHNLWCPSNVGWENFA